MKNANKLISSTVSEVRFWFMLVFLIILFSLVIYQLQQSAPEGSIERQIIDQIKENFYEAVRFIIIGASLLGVLGFVLGLIKFFEKSRREVI